MNDNGADRVQRSSLFSYFKYILFYYTVKYKTITKQFYLQMYKIQDYITYLGYKQKNLCSELLIQYKNMNVSYKLLHFSTAVHWRLPSPF